MSDAGRMLAYVHFNESCSRRELVAINMKKELKDTLQSATVNGWLFGDKLRERVKETQMLERAAQDLKIQKVVPKKANPD